MSEALITPGGNPVCDQCGRWYLGKHECAAAPITPEQIAELWAVAEAAPVEPAWPRRNIDREGTCDGCSETKRLVAAYDDPSGENEPWLCAECASEADFLAALDPPTVLALLDTAEAYHALRAAVEGLRDGYRSHAETSQFRRTYRNVAIDLDRALLGSTEGGDRRG